MGGTVGAAVGGTVVRVVVVVEGDVGAVVAGMNLFDCAMPLRQRPALA